jgi:membrane-bound metal-dependent hydrolase YbcI (DUF457 family)
LKPLPGIVLLGCLALWQVADVLQARLPLSLAWAVLDEVGHAAVALFVILWTWPIWGWRPTLVALLAATAIDIDHVIAAQSLAPSRLMSLDARPAAHSLLGVAVAINLGAALGGPRLAYAAGVGLLTHVLRDAVAPPGAPLLFPFVDEWHMLVPGWSVPAAMFALAAIGVAWTTARPGPNVGTRSRGPLQHFGHALRARASPQPDHSR